jgi:hypothetical protein
VRLRFATEHARAAQAAGSTLQMIAVPVTRQRYAHAFAGCNVPEDDCSCAVADCEQLPVRREPRDVVAALAAQTSDGKGPRQSPDRRAAVETGGDEVPVPAVVDRVDAGTR